MAITQEQETAILNYLLRAETPKWSTSADIVDRLNISGLEAVEIDRALTKYYNETRGQFIRFSMLPSKRDLNVLWGNVNKVGKKDVFSIFREDPITNYLKSEIKDSELENKNLFLSHSFKDTELVVELAKKLKEFDLFSWLAEMDILYRAHINESVIEAIEEAPYFGVFISSNSLKSTWTAKEISFAFEHKKKMVGFVDSSDANWKDIFSNHENHINSRSRVLQDIFRKFFDNGNDVTFITFPEINAHNSLSHEFKNRIEDWNWLKTIHDKKKYSQL